MRKIFLLLCTLLPALALAQSPHIKLRIEVVADSSNHLSAEVQVARNTNGRELMERLFKIEYMDFTKRFVVGIAGFKAASRDNQFWKLEIDGAEAQVGIAEVVFSRDTRVRWSIAKF